MELTMQKLNFRKATKDDLSTIVQLLNEGSETVTNCHQLKMTAKDGKSRLTDIANAETLLRLVQSIPSPKAEPIKLWLAKVGYEKNGPELALKHIKMLRV